MSIWTYADHCKDPEAYERGNVCPFCGTLLRCLFTEYRKADHHNEDYDDLTVSVCQTCGWWKAIEDKGNWGPFNDTLKMPRFSSQTSIQVGSIKNLAPLDLSLPLDEVRSFLIACYEARFSLHPRLFEETVASVFKDQGFDVVVTSYANDGGIDAILTKEDERVGVQVKRYRAAIEVEQIRSLTGALVLHGMTKGVFVTTSRFRSGAVRASAELATKGYSVELLDAQKFYDALKVTQRPVYRSKQEFLEGRDLGSMHKIRGFQGY